VQILRDSFQGSFVILTTKFQAHLVSHSKCRDPTCKLSPMACSQASQSAFSVPVPRGPMGAVSSAAREQLLSKTTYSSARRNVVIRLFIDPILSPVLHLHSVQITAEGGVRGLGNSNSSEPSSISNTKKRGNVQLVKEFYQYALSS
jgi:hypothetical protein